MKTAFLAIFFLGLLAGSIYFAASYFFELDTAFPSGHLLWAYLLGAGFSILVSVGLFTLAFYSARNGYDDIDHDLS